jgi:hypothetical protein
VTTPPVEAPHAKEPAPGEEHPAAKERTAERPAGIVEEKDSLTPLREVPAAQVVAAPQATGASSCGTSSCQPAASGAPAAVAPGLPGLPTASAAATPLNLRSDFTQPAEQLARGANLPTQISLGQRVLAEGSPASGLASIASASPAAAAAAATGRSGDGGGGAVAVGHPPAPAPEPVPSSSGAAAAAGSGSGASSASPFAPVNTLLQAAPTHASRRSRLSQPPWRTSFFALIPERPD